jgi:hypothetical protein
MFAREHRACRKESRRCPCNEFGHTAKLNARAALVVQNLRATPHDFRSVHRAAKIIAELLPRTSRAYWKNLSFLSYLLFAFEKAFRFNRPQNLFDLRTH